MSQSRGRWEKPKPVTPRDGPKYSLGFETLESEAEVDRAPVSGSIPSWLSGSLVRTGPAKFEVGQQKFNHWFDGLGMLHRFTLDGGQVSYGNKYIQSRAYMEAMENDQISMREFATDPDPNLFRHVSHGYEPHGTDNAIVNVVRIRDKVLATTQMPMPIEFDPKTLKTISTFDFEDNLPDGFTTPHPHVDHKEGYLYNWTISLDPPVSHNLYRYDGTTRKLMCTIETEAPSFLNSFAMTETYIIMVEQPYRLDYMKLIAGGTAFANCFDWFPEQPCKFHVIDRETGELLRTFATESFFFLHHINAFEDDDGVVLDMVTYQDPSIIDALYLENLRNGGTIPVPRARRFRVNSDEDRIYSEPLRDAVVELPRINYDKVNGKPYRYFYGFGGYGSLTGSESLTFDFANSLVKVDVEGGPTKVWQQEGCFPGEPIFVPRPGGEAEDDGVLLSVVLDSDASSSFLLVVDALTMEELGRAELPHHIPFSLGGDFFPTEEIEQKYPSPVAEAAPAPDKETFDLAAILADLPPPAADDSGRSGWLKRLGRR
ncbi:MAG TPA: carotenoid oxygenase family protein [Actinomycetota bacterium]|nr:carotenoid oxygenase family protein [Actinomycetota bacterium]